MKKLLIIGLIVAVVAMFSLPAMLLAAPTLAPASATIEVGGKQQFTQKGFSGQGGFTWSSNNTLVATVDNGGIATGVSEGTAKITVSKGNKEASAILTVTAATTTLHALSLEVLPADSGTVSGGGNYAEGATVPVSTTPTNSSWNFVNWTLNGVEVNTNASFDYTMTDTDTTLVANYEHQGGGTVGLNVAVGDCNGDGTRTVTFEMSGSYGGEAFLWVLGLKETGGSYTTIYAGSQDDILKNLGPGNYTAALVVIHKNSYGTGWGWPHDPNVEKTFSVTSCQPDTYTLTMAENPAGSGTASDQTGTGPYEEDETV
ncbi:MAG: Ig-like domain-containing protein, partial [Actinomycetota bacterium]|nr:Ig-like domain-containing protein [Actinomycetota bacterium]